MSWKESPCGTVLETFFQGQGFGLELPFCSIFDFCRPNRRRIFQKFPEFSRAALILFVLNPSQIQHSIDFSTRISLNKRERYKGIAFKAFSHPITTVSILTQFYIAPISSSISSVVNKTYLTFIFVFQLWYFCFWY